MVVSRVAAGYHALLIGAVEYLESLSGRASLVFYRGDWSALAATTSS